MLNEDVEKEYSLIDVIIQQIDSILQSNNDDSVLQQGTKLIYILRQFLTQEEMVFVYRYPSSNHPVEVELTLQYILEHMKVIKNSYTQFSIDHQKYWDARNKQKNIEDYLSHLMKMGVDGTWNQLSNGITIEGGKEHKEAYRHADPDSEVYKVYSTFTQTFKDKHIAKESKQAAYYINAEKSKYFNRGWLAEWAFRLKENEEDTPSTYSETEYQKEKAALREDIITGKTGVFSRLFVLMGGRDADPGGKKGDYSKILDGKRIQVQAKSFNNQKIITLTQIKDHLTELKENLEAFKKSININTTDEDKGIKFNENIINNFYESMNADLRKAVIDTLLKKFDKK